MADVSTLVAFVLASLMLVIVPGPSVLFVISRGVALGRRAAVLTVLGNELGMLVQVLLVAAAARPSRRWLLGPSRVLSRWAVALVRAGKVLLPRTRGHRLLDRLCLGFLRRAVAPPSVVLLLRHFQVETALVEGELAFRQHRGGHTTGPNWPTFLTFADRYIQGPLDAGGPR